VQGDAQVGRAQQARVVGRREPQRAEGDMPQVLRRQRRHKGGALRAAPRDRDQQPRQAARRRARLRAKALACPSTVLPPSGCPTTTTSSRAGCLVSRATCA